VCVSRLLNEKAATPQRWELPSSFDLWTYSTVTENPTRAKIEVPA
jgi:hypothetical protein